MSITQHYYEGQAKHLQNWTEARKKERRGQITPQTETQEYISMQDLEFLMDRIGAFSAVLAIGGILTLVAYWFSPWVILAVGGLTVVIGVGLKVKGWW